MLKKGYYFYNKFMSYIYIYIYIIYFKILKVECKGNYKIRGKLFLRNSGRVIFGDNLLINSGLKYNPIGGQSFTSIVVEKTGFLEIKDNVGISNSSIFCSNKIIIENNVLIGGNCKIYDTDFHSIFIENRIKVPEVGIKSSPLKICEGAFIGAGTTILKGVTVGKNAVIGASSVVSRNIPENEVWAGNPIKKIKKINYL